MVPIAVTVAVSPDARPVIVAVVLVRAVPSYSFSAEPVSTFAAAFDTVRVPFFSVTFVNCSVTSSPSFSIL